MRAAMKPRRPEDRLSDEVRCALGCMPGVIVMRNVVARAVVVGTSWPALLGLGEGTPDLVAIVRGRWLGLELKTATGRLSEAQERCHEAWRAAGAVVVVVRSVADAVAAVEAMP